MPRFAAIMLTKALLLVAVAGPASASGVDNHTITGHAQRQLHGDACAGYLKKKPCKKAGCKWHGPTYTCSVKVSTTCKVAGAEDAEQYVAKTTVWADYVHESSVWRDYMLKTDVEADYLPKSALYTFAARAVPAYQVTTFVGSRSSGFADGAGASASFYFPYDVDISPDGKHLFVADYGNYRIRKVVVETGEVTTLAGSSAPSATDGTGDAAGFNTPVGVAVSRDGKTLFVAEDGAPSVIRQIVIATAEVTTLAGSEPGFADGTGGAAQFNRPRSVAPSLDGTLLFVADAGNSRIRMIVIETGAVSTLAGSAFRGHADGTGSAAMFKEPTTVSISPDGMRLFVTDNGNYRIRQIVIATGAVSTLAGSVDYGHADGTGAAASFSSMFGAAVSPDGALLFVGDNHLIRQVVIATGEVTTIAGSRGEGFVPPDWCATIADFSYSDVQAWLSADGSRYYYNPDEDCYDDGRGFVDGAGVAARFKLAAGAVASPDGTRLFVADFGSNGIRVIQA